MKKFKEYLNEQPDPEAPTAKKKKPLPSEEKPKNGKEKPKNGKEEPRNGKEVPRNGEEGPIKPNTPPRKIAKPKAPPDEDTDVKLKKGVIMGKIKGKKLEGKPENIDPNPTLKAVKEAYWRSR
jgi:hypothetical protein